MFTRITFLTCILLAFAGSAFSVTVLDDDLYYAGSYDDNFQEFTDAGWEIVNQVSLYMSDGSTGVITGSGTTIRYITDYSIKEGDSVSLTADLIRTGSGYGYTGDIIAWDGSTATVISSFSESQDFTHKVTASSEYAGQKLGFTFKFAEGWGKVDSFTLDVVTSVLDDDLYYAGSYTDNFQEFRDADGWEIVDLVSLYMSDGTTGTLTGANGTTIRYISDYVLNYGDSISLWTDLIRTGSGYGYTGDVIAWDGSTATVISSYSESQDFTLEATALSEHAGKQLGFTFKFASGWGKVDRFKLDVEQVDPNYPDIITQPQDQFLKAGSDAVFSVEAIDYSGNGLEYLWYHDPNLANADSNDAVALADGTDFDGATTSELTVFDVQKEDDGGYFCKVSIIGRNFEYSEMAMLKAGYLIAHYPFDGDATDISGNGYDGTAIGTVDYSPDGGMIGQALKMRNASDGHVSVPAEVLGDVAEAFTLSFWTYGSPEQPLSNLQNLFHARGSNSNVVTLRIPHTTGRFQMLTGNPDDGSTQIYTTGLSSADYKNRWNHYVITKQLGQGINVYINGDQWGSFPGQNNPVYGATEVAIGGGLTDSTDTFDGMIDDFRIYNYPFAEDEVKEVNPTPAYPSPEDNATDVPFDTMLSWQPGEGSELFDVYYSTTAPDQYAADFDPNYPLTDPTVIAGLTSPEASFDFNLDLDTTYYWYVVESDVSGNPLWRSNVWSFTTQDLEADLNDSLKVDLFDFAPISASWGEDTKGVVTEAAVIDPMNYDVTNLDPDDPASSKYYWMHYYEYSGGTNLVYGEGYCDPVDDPNGMAIEWSYDTPSSSGGTDASWLYFHKDRSDMPIDQYDELHIDMKLVEGTIGANGMWGNFINTDGEGFSHTMNTSALTDGEWHTIVVPIPNDAPAGQLNYIFCGYWGSNLTGKIHMKNLELVVTDDTPRCVPEFYIGADINNDCSIDMYDLSVLASEWLLDARNL
ncbi:hypothetical protein STSP2_01988 [Anaerohalosphaera lusitana]|uniref:Ig-like domain-containing protein n=2 Tax=Anaerohalosphaera lusitana TaxID=1936003 RepID=A0A1U9NLJ4_9BACT|nr:hypothetical protein STSP2_01988 [Anaerohalosphaera lusitana]